MSKLPIPNMNLIPSTSFEWHSNDQTVFNHLNCGFLSKLFHFMFFFLYPFYTFILKASMDWPKRWFKMLANEDRQWNDGRGAGLWRPKELYLWNASVSNKYVLYHPHLEVRSNLACYCTSSPSSKWDPWKTLFFLAN